MAELKLAQLPGEITKVESLRNGAVRLRFDSQEIIDKEDLAHLVLTVNKFGWLHFMLGEQRITENDLPDIPSIDVEAGETKTASQRLRNVAFVYHQKTGGKEKDFNAWFDKWKCIQIEKFKERID